MTKEQFFAFKNDMKIGMSIAKLEKAHVKAYWNDGFDSQQEQGVAIQKCHDRISELKNGLKSDRILGELPQHHWAYYIAKHRLDQEQSVAYVGEMLGKMSEDKFYSMYFSRNPQYTYDGFVKPILDIYETLVCAD